MNQVTDVVASPCSKVCEVDSTNICIGCYRSIDEIVAWRSLNDSEKKVIIEQAENRKDAANRS